MILIKKDQLNRKIQKTFDYPVEINEDGIYFIEIVAVTKSWWQNLKSFKSFFNDDDLALKIDDIEFPKLNGKNGIFDGESAWNGNNSRGLSKANIFIINLKKGSHTLHFIADQNPVLKSVNIFKVGAEIEYVPGELQSEDGDRRQWITIAVANLDLKHLFVAASAGQYEKNKEESLDADKNIEAGIIYLKWLFGIYGGAQDEYKKVTAAWNAGRSLIPSEGAISFDGIEDLSQRKQAQELVSRVELNMEKKNWNYILMYVFFALLLIGFSIWNTPLSNALQNKKSIVLKDKTTETAEHDRPQFGFKNPYGGIKSIQVSTFYSEDSGWKTMVSIEYEDKKEEKIYNGFLDNAYLFKVVSIKPQFFIVLQEGRNIITSVLDYNEKNKSMQEIKFVDGKKNVEQDICCSYVTLEPMENGVQYDLAVHNSDFEVVYKYDFLKKAFYEKGKF